MIGWTFLVLDRLEIQKKPAVDHSFGEDFEVPAYGIRYPCFTPNLKLFFEFVGTPIII